ncbi:MAG: hypothetical protein DWP97_12985 [Calditrichaeota bacterium]|nr:MAG: hypothetical protein DWP97_12985 [Calditrichota bacterium]
MNVRKLAPLFILFIFIIALMQTGCDTLVTENNEYSVYDPTIAVRCFDCHSEFVNDFNLKRAEGQFEHSAHANYALLDVNDCMTPCHTHEGYLALIDTLSGGTDPVSTQLVSAITCYTCHYPHDADVPYGEWKMDSIRGFDVIANFAFDQGADFGMSNNCANCHKATKYITLTDDEQDFGPHFSPQADIVSGRFGAFVGLTDPLDNTEPLFSTHFNNGCISCHYGSTEDDNSGQGYLFAEHTFRLKDPSTDQMYFGTCQQGNCHASDVMDQNFIDSSQYLIAISALADTVQMLLEAFEILDPSDTTGRTINTATTRTEILDSALYNYFLYNYDNSKGIHNPIFVKQLLDTTKTVLDSLPPIIDFIADAPANCLNTDITFTPTIIGTYDSLEWGFGDNVTMVTLDENPVTHSYVSSGNYSVSLTAYSTYTLDSLNDAGDSVIYEQINGSGTFQRDNYIAIEALINPSFAIDSNGTFVTNPQTVCIGDSLQFVSTSTVEGTPTYTWNFGYGTDTVISTDTITHVFDTVGTLTPILNISTTCYDTTISITDLIIVEGAKAIIDTSYVDTVYTFTSNSIGTLDSLRWDYDGNGIYDSLVSPMTVTYNLGQGQTWVFLQVFPPNCTPSIDSILVNP